MYIENKDNVVVIYPFADELHDFTGFNGSLLISRDKECAPDVAGRLQLRVIFPAGMTREQWDKLKEAGDKAFELAATSPLTARSG